MNLNVCNAVPTYAGASKATIHKYAHLHINRLQVQAGTDTQKLRKMEISRRLVIRSILSYTNCNRGFQACLHFDLFGVNI
jgi:hypothetical protein